MKTVKMFFGLMLAAMVLINFSLVAQEKTDTTMSGHKMMKHGQQKMQGMMHDSSAQHQMHSKMKMQDSSKMHGKMMMKDSTKMHGKMMMKDSGKHMMMDKKEMKDEDMSSIVRKGEIDLKAIDENNDGKVYQDVMDWNVISDSAGECPLCGMTLREVTLDKAKENLMKHHFKVKGASETK